MSYDVYFKEEDANYIAEIIDGVFDLDNTLKKVNVPSITINQGMIEIGPYSVPVTSILFIKEVT